MKKSFLKPAWRVTRPLLIAYLLVVLLMTFLETWLVYPAPPRASGDWTASQYPHEDVEFQSADGTQLHGWLFEHPSPRYYIVYFHGNGEHVAYNADRMDELRRELEASVFIFDYRGYGKSEGSPNESGLIADGIAAQNWMADRLGVATEEIVLMGRSIGGGVAVAVAAQQGAKALVLENTFASMVDTAAGLYRWLPVRLVMRNRYDSLARIANYKGPVLQTHGDADSIVPIAQGRQLFEAIPSKNKSFLAWPNGMHNDPQPTEYLEKLRDFLNQQVE
jgi:uncharacterized protein